MLRAHPGFRVFVSVAAAAAVLIACSVPEPATTVPLRDDLAGFGRGVTTGSELAQRYFDQGLTLYYGFNHEAAIQSFAQAAEIDPECAMAFWGRALAAGPNINNMEMDEDTSRLAWESIERALRLADTASSLERALIEALRKRYAWPPPEDRSELDQAYADAMLGVWTEFPDDPDVGSLFAESLMDLYPWDLWSPEGDARPVTPEVIATLERVLEMAPDHPGANHFYIHAVEASPEPERALVAADALLDRIPGAGHLRHMPSHIYIRTGRYAQAIDSNRKAIEADRPWIEAGGFYTLYRAHNYHFLAYAAMFQGARETAMKAARDMIDTIPLDLVRTFPDYLDGFIGVPYHVMVRFGLWEDILSEPEPAADLPLTRAFWRHARVVAFAATGRVEEAEREFDAFREACDAVPESRLVGNNTARAVLDVGLPMAEGELEYRRGNHERAFDLLRVAVQRDDGLHYDEPWGWMMPVRHSLGALLLERGRVEDAEAAYREDLRRHPNNGWALHGLAECLHRLGRHAEAAEADRAFRTAWEGADIDIKASCYCRTDA
jgi:tetratricopeptide (TPR) repeat protein